MADKVVFDAPLLLGFLTALPAFAGADAVLLVTAFDFSGLGAADLDADADGRAMVNSFGGW